MVRPWGTYEVLCESQGYKVKRIIVNPGCQLSYQYHLYREEYWYVVEGKGILTLNEIKSELKVGDTVTIRPTAKHRVQASKDHSLIFVEVQRGDYLGEDDIVRLKDDYGRITNEERS